MIIAITDAKDMTPKIAKLGNNYKNIKKCYERFFINQIAAFDGNIQWRIVKTTGDGLLIVAKSDNENKEFCLGCLQVLSKLYKTFLMEKEYPRLRILAHYCDNSMVVEGLTLNIEEANNFSNFNIFNSHIVNNDIFGPELNLAFRLVGMVSDAIFFINEGLMWKLVQFSEYRTLENVSALVKSWNWVQTSLEANLEISFSKPIPITYLKGLDSVSFSQSVGKPHWVWEIIV